MLTSTAAFTARQLSLGRRPQAQLLLKDYSVLLGVINDDDSGNTVGGSADVALATKYTPNKDITVNEIHLFMKSDNFFM